MTEVHARTRTEYGGDDGSTTLHISVVVCAYNEERRLLDCLESLNLQDLPKDSYEVVLVDDGSHDSTRELALQYTESGSLKYCLRYVRISHAGLSVARNRGVREARAGIVAFMDADASAPQGWLSQLVQAFSANDLVAVGGRVTNHIDGPFWSHYLHAVHYAAVQASNLMPIVGTNMAFRRWLLTDIPFFAFFSSRGDEVALLSRIRQFHSARHFRYLPEVVVQNEHPERITAWLRMQFSDGRLSATIAKYVAHSPQFVVNVRYFSSYVGRSLFCFAFPISFVFAALRWSELLVISVALVFARLLPQFAYIGQGLAFVKQIFGFWRSLLSPFLAILGIYLRDLGFICQGARDVFGFDSFSYDRGVGVVLEYRDCTRLGASVQKFL